MNNILDNDIKSISIDSLKFKNIFNKYKNHLIILDNAGSPWSASL